MEKLIQKLSLLGLCLTDYSDGSYSVNHPAFANPLLFFGNYNTGKFYNGTVEVKSININLFSPEQIVGAIQAVDCYLSEAE